MNKEVNPISDEDKKQADDVKNQGNDEFKKGNFTRAIELYGKAISLNPNEASYYSNRAACYHKMKKYDSCSVAAPDPCFLPVKVLQMYRRC